MPHRAEQDDEQQRQPWLAGHGRRTRVAVALIGLLVSLGVPAAVLSSPVPTVDGHPIGSLVDPAGLGVTGALPGDPLAAAVEPSAIPTAVPEDGLPRDSASVGLPGIPTPPNLPDGPLGIPGVVLDAYQFAQRTLLAVRPGCHLSWPVLAGIGRIESDHASDGRVDNFGTTLGPILGPRLDGSPGMAAIPDTDHGVLDQDTTWDRAVGPMQFIPSSWRGWGVDGNGDGVANPNNIYDSTVATGLYLCAGGANLSDPAQLQEAIFRYNHSATYVDVVLRWARAYLTGVVPTLSAPGPVPPGINGNGGVPTVPDAAPPAVAPPAAAPPAAAQVAAMAPAPTATSSTVPAPPPVTTVPSPATTPAAPSPSPSVSTTTSPPETTSPGTPPSSPPPEPATTTPAATSQSAPPPAEPGSSPPSPPSATPIPTATPSPSPTPAP